MPATHNHNTLKPRCGRRPSAQLARPDYPYVMRLGDGRVVYVEVPGRWTTTDRGGQVGFLPDGVRFLDRVRVLAMEMPLAPSPGFITVLRQAVGLTQAELAARIGVDKMTVSRWERGRLRPGADAVTALRRLRERAVERGVVLPA